MSTLDCKLLTSRHSFVRDAHRAASPRILAAAGSVAACALYGRARLLRWGASDDEIAGSLPGDDVIVAPNIYRHTRSRFVVART